MIKQCIENQLKHQTYSPEDAILMVDEIKDFHFTDVKTKERLIQSGQAHYSTMLSKESLPTEMQMEVFEQSLERYKDKIAYGVMYLANNIQMKMNSQKKNEIVLISLIRAGLPLGVSIQRYFRSEGVKSTHYGVSIIRDKGIDSVAMKAIIKAHPNAFIAFIDGWIGKGAISRQLSGSCIDLGIRRYFYALSDPTRDLTNDAPYKEDWLIPFGILGSVVSGLLSRTIYQEEPKLHGAIFFDDEEFKRKDVTQHYLKVIDKAILSRKEAFKTWNEQSNQYILEVLDGNDEPLGIAPKFSEHGILTLCKRIMAQFNVSKLNNVKPSIAEATRAVLRRVPEKVLVKDKNDPDVALLLNLCAKNGIEVGECDIAPYRAVTIIKNS
jgi:hypothetical protein cdifQCD-6_08152